MHVYIIKSFNKNWFYVGLSNNLIKRINEHNKGLVKSTKPYRPFQMIYSKSFDNRIVARSFEKYLKIRSNKEKLLRVLKYI